MSEVDTETCNEVSMKINHPQFCNLIGQHKQSARIVLNFPRSSIGCGLMVKGTH